MECASNIFSSIYVQKSIRFIDFMMQRILSYPKKKMLFQKNFFNHFFKLKPKLIEKVRRNLNQHIFKISMEIWKF